MVPTRHALVLTESEAKAYLLELPMYDSKLSDGLSIQALEKVGWHGTAWHGASGGAVDLQQRHSCFAWLFQVPLEASAA